MLREKIRDSEIILQSLYSGKFTTYWAKKLRTYFGLENRKRLWNIINDGINISAFYFYYICYKYIYFLRIRGRSDYWQEIHIERWLSAVQCAPNSLEFSNSLYLKNFLIMQVCVVVCMEHRNSCSHKFRDIQRTNSWTKSR